MASVIRPIECDVLVLGAGLAGLAAALEAAAAGARVVVAAGPPGSSPRAQGGIAAALGPGDSPELHAADTLRAGGGLGDPEAVRLLTASAPAAIAWLQEQGVHFDPEPALEAGHSQPRVLHASGDRSGRALMRALQSSLRAQPGISLLRSRLLALAGEGACAGAYLEAGLVRARATVLATGGYAGLYQRTTNSRISSGLGLVAAQKLGAVLADLDLVQFHPTVHCGPGPAFLVTEALRGAGARLLEPSGHSFVDELAPRDVVAREIALRGWAWLDATHLGAKTLQSCFPAFVDNCRRAGLDPSRDRIPVSPAAHYTMGGVVTDLEGWTGVPGLFAAGECARTGVHGANRLGSNSLLEAVVFGRRAGRAAASWADSGLVLEPGPPPFPTLRGRPPLAKVRRLLDRAAGVLREKEQLRAALHALRSLERARPEAQLATQLMEAALATAQASSAGRALP